MPALSDTMSSRPSWATMSTAMMSAPSRASVMAWLRPWPRAAPVMKATLPSTRPVIVLSSLSLCVCCVQHVVLALAGFRTKAGERVGGGRAGPDDDRHRPGPRRTAWRGPGPERAAVGVVDGRAGCGGRVGLPQCGLPVTLGASGVGAVQRQPGEELGCHAPAAAGAVEPARRAGAAGLGLPQPRE